jgi:hypothetical protein
MRPGQQVVAAIAVTFAVLIVPVGRMSGIATADGSVVLGGGAGILVNGTYCTLTTIGHDNRGELVGFTAATCGGPGAEVLAESAQPSGAVGTVAATNDDLDYAVIKLDSAKVVPSANIDGFPINGLGPDPSLLQPFCKQGGATGNGCGSVTVQGGKPSTVTGKLPLGQWQPGDEGAPVTVDGLLVGLLLKGHTNVDLIVPGATSRISFTLFSFVLNDVNAKGGPGAGFSPVPA